MRFVDVGVLLKTLTPSDFHSHVNPLRAVLVQKGGRKFLGAKPRKVVTRPQKGTAFTVPTLPFPLPFHTLWMWVSRSETGRKTEKNSRRKTGGKTEKDFLGEKPSKIDILPE